MGKKYIAEIGRLERLYKASVNGNGKPNLTWLSPEVDLTPYTEPDLEQVKTDAYNDGYKAGRKAEKVRQPDLEQVRKEAYEQGQEDLRKSCVPKDEEAYGIGYNEGFQCGLDLAWWAARKICSSDCMTPDIRKAIFGWSLSESVMDRFTASEAIEKLKTYEQEKEEIKVWNEVVNGRNIKGAVTAIEDDGTLTIFCQDGIWIKSHARFWKKTGRTFPEIANVLEKMRGEQDGRGEES